MARRHHPYAKSMFLGLRESLLFVIAYLYFFTNNKQRLNINPFTGVNERITVVNRQISVAKSTIKEE
jgi:hypothetical protein